MVNFVVSEVLDVKEGVPLNFWNVMGEKYLFISPFFLSIVSQ